MEGADRVFNTPEYQSEIKRLFEAHWPAALDLAIKIAKNFDGSCLQTSLVAIAMLAMELQDVTDSEENYGLTLKSMIEYAKLAKAKRDFVWADAEGTA